MSKPKLLLVDDDRGVLDSFADLLSKHFEVHTNETVEGGISEISTNKYVVAIIDMHFRPDDPEGGMRVIDYIIKNNVPTKAIVLTAFGNIENCRDAMKEGVFDYVEKGQAHTNDMLLAAALEAATTSQQIVIELSDENIHVLDELQQAINTDRVGLIREGIRILNWAINEWKQERKIASIKDYKQKLYPNLLKEGEG